MAIRFPSMHIAASVQNRIVNMAAMIPAQPTQQISAPEPSQLGQHITKQVTKPVEPMGAPANAEAIAATASMSGGSAADALGQQAVTDAFL